MYSSWLVISFTRLESFRILSNLYDMIVDNVNFENGFLKEMDSWKKFLNCMQSFCVSEWTVRKGCINHKKSYFRTDCEYSE